MPIIKSILLLDLLKQSLFAKILAGNISYRILELALLRSFTCTLVCLQIPILTKLDVENCTAKGRLRLHMSQVAHWSGTYLITRSISTPPLMGCQYIEGYPSIKFVGTYLYTWVEEALLSVLPKNTTQCPCQGLNPDCLNQIQVP